MKEQLNVFEGVQQQAQGESVRTISWQSSFLCVLFVCQQRRLWFDVKVRTRLCDDV